MSTTLVACGTSDRDIYSDAGEVITDTAFNELSKQLPDSKTNDDEYKNESSETEIEDSEETEEIEENDVETDTETEETIEYTLNPNPLDDPDYSNDCPLVWGEHDKEIIDLDPAQFWIDENTFDLTKYCNACGIHPCYDLGDEAYNPLYKDPQNDGKDKIANRFGCFVYDIQVYITTDAMDPTSSIMIGDNIRELIKGESQNTLIGYGHIDRGVEAILNGSDGENTFGENVVRIYGYDQVVDRDFFEMFLIVVRRLMHHDEKCLLRGFGINHSFTWTDNSFEVHDD